MANVVSRSFSSFVLLFALLVQKLIPALAHLEADVGFDGLVLLAVVEESVDAQAGAVAFMPSEVPGVRLGSVVFELDGAGRAR